MKEQIIYSDEWVTKASPGHTGLNHIPGTISTHNRAIAEELAKVGVQLVKVLDTGELGTRYVFDGSDPETSNLVFAKIAFYTEMMRRPKI